LTQGIISARPSTVLGAAETISAVVAMTTTPADMTGVIVKNVPVMLSVKFRALALGMEVCRIVLHLILGASLLKTSFFAGRRC
jgi:hypothetical protein